MCPLSFIGGTSGHSLKGSRQQRLVHKRTVRKCCIASLSLTSVAAAVKHFRASTFNSNNVGGKPQAARAISWFWHLFVNRKLTLGCSFSSNKIFHSYAQDSLYKHSFLQPDNNKHPLGNQGLSDLLKGTSPRFFPASRGSWTGDLPPDNLPRCPLG